MSRSDYFRQKVNFQSSDFARSSCIFPRNITRHWCWFEKLLASCTSLKNRSHLLCFWRNFYSLSSSNTSQIKAALVFQTQQVLQKKDNIDKRQHIISGNLLQLRVHQLSRTLICHSSWGHQSLEPFIFTSVIHKHWGKTRSFTFFLNTRTNLSAFCCPATVLSRAKPLKHRA